MKRRILAGVVVVALLSVAGIVEADPFVNTPELNHPNWATPFPYQRNIMVGFDTDPHLWPDHISSPVPNTRKALTPSVVRHQGIDDQTLYPSDWLAADVQPSNAGFTEWLETDTETGSNRQGILVLNGQSDSTFSLVWHIDNWDQPRQEKHFFVEAEFYTTGREGIDELLSSTGQLEMLSQNLEMLPDGWVRWHSWATLTPNPEWEEMVNTITFEQPGMLLLDFMHIATECVPEPSTIALLGISVLGLIAFTGRNR